MLVYSSDWLAACKEIEKSGDEDIEKVHKLGRLNLILLRGMVSYISKLKDQQTSTYVIY